MHSSCTVLFRKGVGCVSMLPPPHQCCHIGASLTSVSKSSTWALKPLKWNLEHGEYPLYVTIHMTYLTPKTTSFYGSRIIVPAVKVTASLQ